MTTPALNCRARILPDLLGREGSVRALVHALKRAKETGRLHRANLFAGSGQPAICAACRDPHGSQKNLSPITFDKRVVPRPTAGAPDYRSLGLRHGSRILTCHGCDHVQNCC